MKAASFCGANFRITYKGKDGQPRYYFIAAENAVDAISDFRIRTGNGKKTVIAVDIEDGTCWKRTL